MPPQPTTDLSKAFGAVIAECRAEAKLTQVELAQECGLARSYIGFLESGQTNATIKVLFKLASVLGIEPDALIARTRQQL